MKIKTSELTGTALNWAVGLADNRHIRQFIGGGLEARGRTESGAELPDEYDIWMIWTPSASWAQGGPIIEREGIGLDYYPDGGHPQGGEWGALTNEGTVESFGPTPLIAAMRCYVASKLGDEVEIPNNLIREQP